MSDIDLDEDLLALAGAGGSDSESNSDAPLDSKKSSGNNKRKAFADDEEEDHGSDDDDDEARQRKKKKGAFEESPYPLEGKYIDEDDKLRIESMDEMAREELLYSRAQEMNDYNERLYLVQRAAREKNQLQEERSTRSKKVKESTKSKKSSKLSELKKQRDRKARKEAGDEYSEEDDDYDPTREEDEDDYKVPEDEGDDDYDLREEYDEEDDYNPDQVEWATERRAEPVRDTTVSDINKIRVGRYQVSKFLYYPEFKDVVKDCVARFNIGLNRMTNQPTYRMIKILGIERGRKPYRLEKGFVNLFAICSIGKGSPKKVSMDFFSNSPITQEELDKFKSYEGQIPSVKKIEKKYSQLKEMATRVLTPQEIKVVTQQKQSLNRDYTGANAVIRRAELTAKLEVAKQQSNASEIQKIENELSKYQSARQRATDKHSKYDKLSTLDKVNERNRKKNQDLVRKAEILASERRRKESSGAVMSNPFSRLKTNVRLYYQNIQQEEAEKAQQDAQAEEAEKAKKEKAQEKFFVKAKYRQVGELDKLISNSVNITVNF